jgi:uncharacterized protein (DUF849 family)
MNQANKVIITCAVTGSIHTPTMSDALPITPNEIAEQAIAAAEAGAAILVCTENLIHVAWLTESPKFMRDVRAPDFLPCSLGRATQVEGPA